MIKRQYTKQEMKYRRLCENNNFFVVPKGRLKLKEDDDSNAYVEPSKSNTNSSSLASDLSRTISDNPTDDTFVINSKNYDNNGGNQVPTFDINATNSSDAAQQYQNIMRNPDMKRISSNGGANVKIHLNTESLEYRKENSIPFTKAELNKLLKN